ncbi:hypothetical protein Pan161_22140 [Gimesia algae]|uniref:Uncharacterized protein n=1 Tax=Gimesia algae TaxID=2527971 RepID=A0A517VC36_9PLAN|nr:hypothetical protein Pan161_22140 [Gimesia algae]
MIAGILSDRVRRFFATTLRDAQKVCEHLQQRPPTSNPASNQSLKSGKSAIVACLQKLINELLLIADPGRDIPNHFRCHIAGNHVFCGRSRPLTRHKEEVQFRLGDEPDILPAPETVSSFPVASPGPFGPSIIDCETLWLNVMRTRACFHFVKSSIVT